MDKIYVTLLLEKVEDNDNATVTFLDNPNGRVYGCNDKLRICYKGNTYNLDINELFRDVAFNIERTKDRQSKYET